MRGWQPIHQSDMLLQLDPKTARMDPFTQHKTLMVNGNVVDPLTKKPYSRDPRSVSLRAIDYLRTTGSNFSRFRVSSSFPHFSATLPPRSRPCTRLLRGSRAGVLCV